MAAKIIGYHTQIFPAGHPLYPVGQVIEMDVMDDGTEVVKRSESLANARAFEKHALDTAIATAKAKMK